MTGYDVDVLVAGAGPVGLMAASRLAQSGVSVRLVDAAAGPATTSRALGAHARSL
ncbi:NAD(P)-binding protein, partial [Streptomyces sp. SID11233]|nr:NAD(P)-binding protein [Streptomyces sp. SID11233]